MKNKDFIEKLEHDNNPVVPGLVSSVEYLKLNLPPVFFYCCLLSQSVFLSYHVCTHVYRETCLLTALASCEPYLLELHIKRLLPLALICQLSERD